MLLPSFLHRSMALLNLLFQEASTSYWATLPGPAACWQALCTIEKKQMEILKFVVSGKVERM